MSYIGKRKNKEIAILVQEIDVMAMIFVKCLLHTST